MDRKIGIVTVTFNSGKVIKGFLESLKKQAYKNFILIIVDNNSNDNTIELINNAKLDFDYKIMRNKINYGFAKGSNIGIKYCEKINCDYVLLLNNDTVFNEDLLLYLLEASMNNSIRVIIPKIYYYKPNNMIWMAGGKLNHYKGNSEHLGYNKYDEECYNRNKIVDFAPGCCMFMDIRIFFEIGYLDESYFVYLEDTDLCARLNKKGIRILYYPKAIIWHKVSSLTANLENESKYYYMIRNWLYYLIKNEEGIYRYLSLSYYIITRLGRFIISNNDKRKLLIKSIRDACLLIMQKKMKNNICSKELCR